ncbi:MAG: thiamine ABC transporter substrate-binding protein, partial [Hydrogenophaga sp.]
MQRRLFSLAMASGLAAGLAGPVRAQQVPTLRVLTHSSFDLPADLLTNFERQAGVKLQVVKGGDAGDMLNRLILTRANPIADVVFGIDNTLLPRALTAQVIEPYTGPAAQRPASAAMAEIAGPTGALGGVVPVDHGFVTLTIDTAWFAKAGL